MSNSGMYGVTPPSTGGGAGSTPYQLPQGIKENKLSNDLAQMRNLQLKLVSMQNTPYDTNPRKFQDLGKRYQDLYDKWSGKGVDLSQYGEFGQYDPLSSKWTPYSAQSATGEPMTPGGDVPKGDVAPGGGDGSTPPSIEDVTSNPFGPSSENFFDWLKTSNLPAGINLNNPDQAKMIETLYPIVRDAYNMQMQQEGIGTAAKSVEDYKNDPLLQKLAAGMADKLANPFTFDEETLNLMRGQTADTLANQEAAMGERLRSLGATSGISPDSPLYASMAQQASLARDLGQQQAERNLQIQKAMQDQADWYRAFSAGGQFAGAYQSGLGQRMAGLTGAQLGGKFQDLGNPFAGLWSGLLMEDQLNQDPGFAETWGPLIGSGIQGLGQVGSAYLMSQGGPGQTPTQSPGTNYPGSVGVGVY